MTRAVLEGVAFGLKDSFTLIQNAGLSAITQVRASGGGTKGALWRQIMASVLDAELVTVNTTEGGAYGAALLAGVGAGTWTDVVSACKACIKITGSTLPDKSQVAAYRKPYAIYQELYPALKPSFGKIGQIAG
jgi:xylulokinase